MRRKNTSASRAASSFAAKKIRKREKRTIFTPFFTRIIKRKHLLLAGTLFFGVLLGIALIFKNTLRSSSYSITTMSFSPESIERFDDPLIYREVASALEKRNYFMVKRFKRDEILHRIQQDFPLVSDITLEQQSPQTFLIGVTFQEPALVFLLPDGRRYASFQEHLYALASGNTLGSDSIKLELPRFTSTLRSLDGIFYEISEQELVEAMTIILSTLGEQNINERIYLPGGNQLFLGYKGKRIYLHLKKDINAQLAKLIDLENHYPSFSSVGTLDIGSTDDTIVE